MSSPSFDVDAKDVVVDFGVDVGAGTIPKTGGRLDRVEENFEGLDFVRECRNLVGRKLCFG